MPLARAAAEGSGAAGLVAEPSLPTVHALAVQLQLAPIAHTVAESTSKFLQASVHCRGASES